MASWTNLPPFRVLTATSVTRMDQLIDNITMLASHAHTGADGDGGSALSVWATATCPCETAHQGKVAQFIIPFIPDSHTNFNRVVTCPVYPNGGIIRTTAGVSASGACIAWSVHLPGQATTGAWWISMGWMTGPDSGCIAACLGGSPLFVDGGSAGASTTYSLYSAAVASSVGYIWATNDVTASAIYSFKIQVVGKDTSSTGFHAMISHISIVHGASV